MNTDQYDYTNPRRGGRFGARLLGLALAGAIALAACGGADDPTDRDDEPTPSETTLGTNETAPAAGWYPDPAGRFDLRYWDGSQWTEHVARGGQQDTDPPVRDS